MEAIVLTELRRYAADQGASEEVLAWCDTTLAAHLKRTPAIQTEVEHVLDYLMSPEAPTRLRRMSYAQALTSAEVWTKVQQRRGAQIIEGPLDVAVAFTSGDFRVVKLLSKQAYLREGMLMSHCLGGYTPTKDIVIYSLRDANNQPHATFEVRKAGSGVQQIKGKGNGAIHPRYIDAVLDFLTYLKQDVRPSEMQNLGYYAVDAKTQALYSQFVDSRGKGPTFTMVRGNLYLVAR
jgi:hypothetical protein